LFPGLVAGGYHHTRKEYGKDKVLFVKAGQEGASYYSHCDAWRSISQYLLANYSRGPFSSYDIDAILLYPARVGSLGSGVPRMDCCTQALTSIRRELEERFKALTPFSDFMRGVY
jgi:hypothetical protein